MLAPEEWWIVMSLAVDLGRYKWYQSQVLDDVSAFSLFPEGGKLEAVCQ